MIFIAWLICFAVTIYILHQRGQLNPFLFILALLIWPMALIAAAMLPKEDFTRLLGVGRPFMGINRSAVSSRARSSKINEG
jgi:hypothetical protein